MAASGGREITFEGGCYRRKVRYAAEGEPRPKAQRHCRECQCISGGAPNLFMLMPPEGFRYVSSAPKSFTRDDLDQPVTREFCDNCGAHLTTRRPGLPFVILKVGTLDDPSVYGAPQMGIYTVDKQPFHMIPGGLPTFERLPPRQPSPIRRTRRRLTRRGVTSSISRFMSTLTMRLLRLGVGCARSRFRLLPREG